jgi:hypothetical protein
MARIIKADNTVTTVKPPKGSFTLEELQAAVGGYIEVVRVPNSENLILVVNEEGLLKKLPLNEQATLLAQQPIVGDVVLCTLKEMGE